MDKARTLRYKFLLHHTLSPRHQPELDALRGKRKCIVCLAADYGNLGDVAITHAQEKFLHEKLQGYEIVDFPISKTLSYLKALKHICSSDDIITIVGGGNMGDMYYDIELLRLLIVSEFPNNKIISFPQTIDYSNSGQSRWLQSLSKRIYSRHNNLWLCARESVSLETMRRLYPACNICLAPDIVMSLDKRRRERSREGIILCLRDDKEQGKFAHVITKLKKDFAHRHLKVTERDTHIGRGNLTTSERDAELDKIWAAFSDSQWVITDRLHGMIFAYITGTPAIVFPNSNFKIEKSYQWIKDCGYIYFVNDTGTDIIGLLDRTPDTSGFMAVHNKIMDSLKNIPL